MSETPNLSLSGTHLVGGETVFERPRGLSQIEILSGYAQIQISGLRTANIESLLEVLKVVSDGGVSIDFVKLTAKGFSFVCAEGSTSKVEELLQQIDGCQFSVREARSIVLAHAVGIRDEEGLIAKMVHAAIRAGAHVDHIGDMHDRLLMVVSDQDASKLKQELERTVGAEYKVSGAQVAYKPSAQSLTLPVSKGIKVMKFGGTSVAKPSARMTAALKVLSAREQGYLPVVVVSAIGRKGEPYATDTLLSALKEIDPNVPVDGRESDLMVACGEIISAVIFAHLLKTLGVSAQAFRGGQAGIRTDGVYGNARIVGVNPASLFKSVSEGMVPVVCGFQGVYVAGDGSPGGELTTLGRGGSDTTASAVGAAMSAQAVEIYTDVDGVKTADPSFVSTAPTLRKVTYDEVAEIAHLGAKVVHPRAAEIAMNSNIPLWVKNTFSDEEGTEIVNKADLPGTRVTGVTHTGKLVYLRFRIEEAPEEHRDALSTHVYNAMANYNVNLYMVNLNQGGTGFAVPREQYPIVRDVFDGLVVPVGGNIYLFQIGAASPEVSTQAALLEPLGNVQRIPIQLTEGCTMVSVVGHEYLQQPGIFYTVLSTLHESSIPVLQTTDSNYSLSCLIPESELHRAVRLLHDAFALKASG